MDAKPKPIKIRSDIMEFAGAMEFEMSQKDHERGDRWKEEDLDFLHERLHDEAEEIMKTAELLDFCEMDRARLKNVMREAADAGNFAMMIWCQCRDRLGNKQ